MVTLTEADITQRSTRIGRQCGGCSLCCFMLDVVELAKPQNMWCPNCRLGEGCAIYHDRPGICRGYTCAWLVNGSWPDYWYPLQSKMIIDFEALPDRPVTLRVHCHPSYPDVWRQEPYFTDLKRRAERGQTGPNRYRVMIGNGREWTHLVLPDGAVPLAAQKPGPPPPGANDD